MVHSQSRRQPASIIHHRANPAGMGRLLAMAATIALMTMGHGILWWAGLFLLALILVAIGQPKKAWRKVLALLGILAAMSFTHLDIIPLWTGITFAVLAAGQWALSLLF